MKEPVESKEELEQRLEADLTMVRDAIAANRIEEAKSKLAGITISCLPGSKCSQDIGNLYYDLGCPILAGLNWYLLENKNQQMQDTCESFEHSLGDNPLFMDIFFCGSHLATQSPSAKAKLNEIRRKYNALQQESQYRRKTPRGIWIWMNRLGLLGCGIIATIALFIFILEIISIGTWFR
jgi:hypothetical protein